MAAVLAGLSICTTVTVATDPNEAVFTFIKPDYFRRAGEDDCKICYGDTDCFTMNVARCEFYTATSEVLYEDDSPADSRNPMLRAEVDSLMTDLANESSHILAFQECVPFVSYYTDCTKENICFGCRSCSCNEYSKWNCSSEQHCRAEEPLEVDHRVLVITMETLRGDEKPSFRLKRSIPNTATLEPHNLTFEELAEWMYETQPLNSEVHTNTTDAPLNFDGYSNLNEVDDADGTTKDAVNDLTTVEDTTPNAISEHAYIEPDYTNIAFDDVLSSIFQNDNYTRRKTLNMSQSDNDLDQDSVKTDDVNVTLDDIRGIGMADKFVHLLHAIEGYEPQVATTTEGVTKIVIDLLEITKKKIQSTSNGLNSSDTKVTLQNDTVFDDTDNIEFNAINIMKRDVSQVMEDNLNETVTGTAFDRNTSHDLANGVYLPLNNIIQDKLKELSDLLHVREKLIDVLNIDPGNEYSTSNSTEKSETHSNSYINFYNVRIVPPTEYSYKRSGIDLLDKYMMKLRQDVYVVVKDIIRIQTLTGQKDFPKQLKALTHAIKHFMRNHTKSHNNKALRTSDGIFELRRHEDKSHITKDFVKNTLMKILLSIDRDTQQNDPLPQLSIKTRKIIKRIIKTHKLNEYSVFGLRVNDPHYNLTNDLKSIGVNWLDMTVRISESVPWDRLHYMKLLQFVLESDIEKMKEALALIDFAHSRRMIVIHDDINKDELLRINSNLRNIHNQIDEIKKLPFLNTPGKRNAKIIAVTKQNNKETFLKHIKNLLKSSKKNIVGLLRKKVSKADIIKDLAKKRLNVLTKDKLLEYQHIMQKWQNQLDITRKKRSFGFDKFSRRTKNILPKYLRGKVSSGMNSTKHKNKPRHLEKRRSKKNRQKTATMTTPSSTPKSTTRPATKPTLRTINSITSRSSTSSTSTVRLPISKNLRSLSTSRVTL